MSETDRLRAALPWAKDLDDAQLIGEVSRRSKMPLHEVASILGVDAGTKWSNRAGASIDNAQAGLYGVAEAAGLGDWAMRGRQSNQAQADLSSDQARAQGAISSYKDVHGFRDAAEYVGGLAVDSAPQMAATLGAGMLGGLPAAGAVGYSFALGDVLQNQREQAGKTDLLSAAALAVPYAAVDTLSGVGGKLAKGSLARSGLKVLDEMQGIKGAAARTAVSAGKTMLEEGAGETFQEGMNQLGRIAVDPNASMFSDDAMDRYKESFVGGGALGGAFGAIGGHRRSEGYEAPGVDQPGTTDLLTPRRGLNIVAQALPLQDYIDQSLGVTAPEGTKERAAREKAYAAQFEAAASEPSGIYGADPTTGVERELSALDQVQGAAGLNIRPPMPPAPSPLGAAQAPVTASQAPQVINDVLQAHTTAQAQREAAATLTPEQQASKARVEEVKRIAAESRAAQEASTKRAGEFGIVKPAAIETYSALEDAHTEGLVDDNQFGVMAGQLAANGLGKVRKALNDIRKAAEAQAAQAAKVKASDEDSVRQVFNAVQKPAATTAVVTQPAATAATPAAPTTSLTVAPAGQVAGIDADKKVTVGRAGREVTVTPELMLQKIMAAPVMDKMRILAVTGLDMTTDPTTGAPRLVHVGNPMTFEQVAVEEARKFGKKVSRQAIAHTLKKYGIDENVATQVAASFAPTQVTAAELELPSGEDADNMPGFRVESHLSKATGQGLVDDGNVQTKSQRDLAAQADELLKADENRKSGKRVARRAIGQVLQDLTGLDVGATPADTEVEARPEDTPGTVVTDLRDGNAAREAENIRFILSTPEARVAEGYWNNAVVKWSKLPDTLRADWVEACMREMEHGEGELDNRSFRALDSVQQRIEEDHAIIQARAPAADGRPAITGGTGSNEGAARLAGPTDGPSAGSAAEGAADPSVGSGAYVAGDDGVGQRAGDAPKPVVQVKKKRSVSLPAQGEKSSEGAGGYQPTPAAPVEPAAAPAPAPAPAPAAKPVPLYPTNVGATPTATVGTTVTAKAGPGFSAADLGQVLRDEPAPAVEAAVVQEQVAQLSEPQVQHLETHYGVERSTPEFTSKLTADVLAYAAGGAKAVAAAIRSIVRKVYIGVIAGAAIFNATNVHPGTGGIVQMTTEEYREATRPVIPAEAASRMSPAAKTAYEAIFRGLKRELVEGNKLVTIVDKPNARVFVFTPDGQLVLQDKVLMGAALGDLYVGNNTVPANRITPAGLFTMQLTDNAHYDFGKTLSTVNRPGDYSVTLMHSVWTHEADGPKRVKALQDDSAADSRYSFGCINLKKEAYGRLMQNHQGQLDGSKLFVVPDNQAAVGEFLHGAIARNEGKTDELTRSEVPKFSKASEGGSTVARVLTEVSKLKLSLNSDKIVIVQSLSELPAFIQKSVEDANPQAFVLGGRAFLIADNIKPGNARAVFLHEVGVHLGLENLLSAKEFSRLASKITEWADRNDGSQESELARLAIGRVGAAETADDQVQFEQVAYFIEEAVKAGIDPTAMQYKSDLARWFSEVIRALRAGIAKLGIINAEGLTAQDIVDMAYGAAHLEMKSDLRGNIDAPKFSIAGAPKQAVKAQADVTALLKDSVSKGKLWASFTKDLARMAAKLLPSATKYIELVERANVAKTRAERNIESVLDLYNTLPAHERGTGPASVNAFLQNATLEKKWGYKPEYHADAKVDTEMAQKFNRLSPAAQQLVRAVFKHGHDNLQALKSAVMDNINTEFDVLIAAHDAAGATAEAAAQRKAKAKALKDYASLTSLNGNWPYAPLKRFGNQVVVGMSKQYLDAKKAGNNELMQKLQLDSAHYHVQFTETRGEARSTAAKLSEGSAFSPAVGGMVQDFEKDDVHDVLYGGRDTLSAFRRFRSLVAESQDEGLSASTNKALNRLMTDLHLTLLGEASARQAERKRKGVAGADEDMMRAFATQGRATAHFIATLENNGGVQDALRDMKSEADALSNGRRERRDYYNELLRRHAMGLEYRPTPLVDKAMGVSSGWFLLTSPAYFLTNATQPFVMSLPNMAGKHGYGRASAALSKAYRDLLPLLKDGKFSEDDYSSLPADVRRAVEMLADRGFIDISMEQDLGRWRSDEDSKMKVFGRVVDKLRGFTQTVESINRLVTAIAAVRLEAATGASLDKQVESAGRLIYETHGDYTGFNAPRLMRNPVGRLVTQFRKFQLIQLSLYARLLHGAFKGASADERLVARKTLAFNLGHMFLLGGTLGMPGAQMIGFILRQVFGDDDEPDNPELTLRKAIGDDSIADLLLKGVPKLAGVDLSGRLGAGGMLSLLPYADLDVSKKGAENLLVQASGPFLGGLLPKFADGVDLMQQGELWKGLEQILPKGLSDTAKAVRLMEKGMTQRNGDQVMSPDDISLLDGAMQMVGLPTNTLTDRSFRASAKFKANEFFTERTTAIKRDYVEAYRSGDADGMAQARQDWANLQASRDRNGYKRQGLSDLLKAPVEQRKRQHDTAGGVQYGRDNKKFVQELDEIS